MVYEITKRSFFFNQANQRKKETKARDEKEAKADKEKFQILIEASKAEVISPLQLFFNLAIIFPKPPSNLRKSDEIQTPQGRLLVE